MDRDQVGGAVQRSRDKSWGLHSCRLSPMEQPLGTSPCGRLVSITGSRLGAVNRLVVVWEEGGNMSARGVRS